MLCVPQIETGIAPMVLIGRDVFVSERTNQSSIWSSWRQLRISIFLFDHLQRWVQ
jgi:hypothetical protein